MKYQLIFISFWASVPMLGMDFKSIIETDIDTIFIFTANKKMQMKQKKMTNKNNLRRFIMKVEVLVPWVVLFTSCHSMYGIFENESQTLYIRRNHTFMWTWTSHTQSLYSEGSWTKNKDTNRQQPLFQFTSSVVDEYNFPIYVKEKKRITKNDIVFRFTNLSLPSNTYVHILLHVNDSVYPVDSTIITLTKQPADSFYISIYHTLDAQNVKPYPIHKEVRTKVYYPQRNSNDFTIQLYTNKLAYSNAIVNPSEYLYYMPLEFDGYYDKDEYSLEKMWFINPEHPVYLNHLFPMNKSITLLRKRSVIINEWLFAK